MEDSRKLKFVILGDRDVGKRTLLNRAFGSPERLSSFYLPIEFYDVELRHQNRNYNITCYDSLVSTSSVGKTEVSIVEQMTATAFHGADAILFCYASNNQDSYRSLASWYREISVYLTPNTSLYLVRTKSDVAPNYAFSPTSELKIHFADTFEVSGFNKLGVVDMFGRIIERIEDPNSWNKSRIVSKPSTVTDLKESSFTSPDKKSPTKKEVRYSDAKERIVLMEGSYVKRLGVVDESRPGAERSTRLVQKALNEENFEDI